MPETFIKKEFRQEAGRTDIYSKSDVNSSTSYYLHTHSVRHEKTTVSGKTKDCTPDRFMPYERCFEYGPEVLNDAELLAVILRTGSKDRDVVSMVKALFNGDDCTLSAILNMTTVQLMKHKGIGKVKAMQIQCVGELSRRVAKQSAQKSLVMSNPSSIAAYYMEDMRHLKQEHLYAMFVDTKNRLIKDIMLTKGTVNQSMISVRELFIEAIRYQAVYLVLVHNHPSGDPKPSIDDIAVTHQVYDAGKLLGIILLDHIVIGEHCYYSMLEQGKLGD